VESVVSMLKLLYNKKSFLGDMAVLWLNVLCLLCVVGRKVELRKGVGST